MEGKMKHFISVFPKSNATSIALNLIVYFTSKNTLAVKKDWISFLSKCQHKVANSFFFFKRNYPLFWVFNLCKLFEVKVPFHLRNASDGTLCFVEIENLNLLTQSALNFFFYWPVKLEHLETTELDDLPYLFQTC